jgi:hypothetical protein
MSTEKVENPSSLLFPFAQRVIDFLKHDNLFEVFKFEKPPDPFHGHRRLLYIRKRIGHIECDPELHYKDLLSFIVESRKRNPSATLKIYIECDQERGLELNIFVENKNGDGEGFENGPDRDHSSAPLPTQPSLAKQLNSTRNHTARALAL